MRKQLTFAGLALFLLSGSAMGMNPDKDANVQMSADDRAMKEKIMQLPPEQREQAMREYREKRSQEVRGQKTMMLTNKQEQGMSREQYGAGDNHEGSGAQMTPETRALIDRIMQMPPDQRELLFREVKTRHVKGMQGGYQYSAEDKAMAEKIKQMPPEQREQAMREFKERMKTQMQGYNDGRNYGQSHQMSAEDKAMAEKIKQMPPEQREQAIREYKAKHDGNKP